MSDAGSSRARNKGRAQLTKRLDLTLIAKPRPRKAKSSADPPWLMNGKGMPVTGNSPIIIPVLMATWKNSTAANPTSKKAPARSAAIWAPSNRRKSNAK